MIIIIIIIIIIMTLSLKFTGCEDANSSTVFVCDMLDALADLWCVVRVLRRNQRVSNGYSLLHAC